MALEAKKLHIGVGKNYIPGWINFDIFSNNRADSYGSALALPYDREFFDVIYASHVLEHFNRHMILSVLSHWRDLLVDGGILRLAVPDFNAICRRYLASYDLEEVTGLLYGGQSHVLDVHQIVFDATTLRGAMKKVGFKEVRQWKWRATEHSQFDDYSQAYLPHMEKNSGMLMSLNLEGVK
jgi:predicted SAM-dependent methyltransferase